MLKKTLLLASWFAANMAFASSIEFNNFYIENTGTEEVKLNTERINFGFDGVADSTTKFTIFPAKELTKLKNYPNTRILLLQICNKTVEVSGNPKNCSKVAFVALGYEKFLPDGFQPIGNSIYYREAQSTSSAEPRLVASKSFETVYNSITPTYSGKLTFQTK